MTSRAAEAMLNWKDKPVKQKVQIIQTWDNQMTAVLTVGRRLDSSGCYHFV